jgi:hypothetical protein
MLIYKGQNKIYRHDDVEKIKRLIENDYDTVTSSSTHYSYRLEKYLISSGLGDLLDILNSCISFIIIIFYIITTYTNEEKDSLINTLIDTIEIFLCVALMIHFGLKLYVSQNRLYFLFTIDSMIDYGTIIPILLAKQSIFDDIKYILRLL